MATGLLEWLRLNNFRLRAAAYAFLGGVMLLVIAENAAEVTFLKGIGVIVALIAVVGGIIRAGRREPAVKDVVTSSSSRSHLPHDLFFLLLIWLLYSLVSSVVYVMWSELVGWPVVSSEFVLRVVHLVPALVCTILAAALAGANTRMKIGFAPGLVLGSAIALTHFLSYSHILRSGWHYIILAATEAMLLLGAAAISYSAAANRFGLKRAE
jgi:hypothetical protein